MDRGESTLRIMTAKFRRVGGVDEEIYKGASLDRSSCRSGTGAPCRLAFSRTPPDQSGAGEREGCHRYLPGNRRYIGSRNDLGNVRFSVDRSRNLYASPGKGSGCTAFP